MLGRFLGCLGIQFFTNRPHPEPQALWPGAALPLGRGGIEQAPDFLMDECRGGAGVPAGLADQVLAEDQVNRFADSLRVRL